MTTETKRLSALVLAAVGLLRSLALEWVHVAAYTSETSTGLCGEGPHLGCSSVALSRWAVVLGIPLPLWGVALFVALGMAASRRSRAFVVLSGAAALSALLLIGLELFAVRSLCLLCSVVHVTIFASFYLAWTSRDTLRPIDVREELRLAGFPAAFLVASFVFVPHYWALFSWRAGVHLPHGVDASGHSWIGAADSKVVVHEYVDYACPHCALATSRMRLELSEHASGFRLVRHQYPRMRCSKSPSMLQCQYSRAALCALPEDKFWQMDSWLFEHAPGKATVDFRQATKDVGLDAEKFLQCLVSDDTFAKADAEAHEAMKDGIQETPTYVLDGKKFLGQSVFAALRARL